MFFKDLQKNILSFFNTSLLSCIILCTSEVRQELTMKLFYQTFKCYTAVLLTLIDIFKTCTVVILNLFKKSCIASDDGIKL